MLSLQLSYPPPSLPASLNIPPTLHQSPSISLLQTSTQKPIYFLSFIYPLLLLVFSSFFPELSFPPFLTASHGIKRTAGQKCKRCTFSSRSISTFPCTSVFISLFYSVHTFLFLCLRGLSFIPAFFYNQFLSYFVPYPTFLSYCILSSFPYSFLLLFFFFYVPSFFLTLIFSFFPPSCFPFPT